MIQRSSTSTLDI